VDVPRISRLQRRLVSVSGGMRAAMQRTGTSASSKAEPTIDFAGFEAKSRQIVYIRSMTIPVELIVKKRDGYELSSEEIHDLIALHVSGDLPDYQMSALLMAIVLRGMTDGETAALTHAMLHSGEVLTLPGVAGIKVDKHSTGGVGDKVSICLAPLVAACGVPVPMVCGRGLGHTGGTLDKLEAIPGFRTDLDAAAFARIVSQVGVSIIGQTREIAPADRRLYALRDVTGTVESVPLIVASILSKKLAEGIDGLVLDVKAGGGAFMPDLKSARALATALVRVGARAGKRVVALLTDMGAPLGRTVGNALETAEAIDLLHGKSLPDLLECTLELGTEMLLIGGKATSRREARSKLTNCIASGAGARVLERMIEAQGGNPAVVEDPSRLPRADMVVPLFAPRGGEVEDIDAREIGLSAVALGAGRATVDQRIDHAVGFEILVKPGSHVERGTVLANLHVRSAVPDIEKRVLGAFHIGSRKSAPRPLLLGRIDAPPAPVKPK
jgi:pyrimidine-nucleoside phosphorylase